MLFMLFLVIWQSLGSSLIITITITIVFMCLIHVGSSGDRSLPNFVSLGALCAMFP